MTARPKDAGRAVARARDAARKPAAAKPRAVAAELPAAPEPAATRACVAMLAALALLAVARAWAGSTHGMGTWGINTLRFVPPIVGWPLWGIAALALIPPLARPLAATVARVGDSIANAPARAAWIAAPLAAAVVL